MYTEGMGYAAISRVLDVKPETIYSWVKKALQAMAAPESERARRRLQVGVKVISLDEMWTYVGVKRGAKRNSRRIWTAVAEDALGNRWKRFEVGDRSASTLLRLLERLLDAACYSSDAYGAYGCLPVNKRKVGKGGAVNGNEGLHSALRGRLNRLVRLTNG